jgi:hypothetical protein
MRPKQKMEMISHQTIPDDAHRNSLVRGHHQLDERGKVVRLVKDIIPPVSSIEDMIDKAALRCA